ncbi:MAG: NAD(P)/FAD-dependent oxidoreductase [Dehalococcoidia bacterium]|nr:NAD(P)/FAD-dependent oxidoreductase [Dehalococcoidia bacterium]
MKTYDAVVVGGGIAGSVAARFLAEHGLHTLLLEKHKTPRNKACSGIQFMYLERLVGERIPRDALCRNELRRVEMVTPSGKAVIGRMAMLNFWRSTFDSWLNSIAVRKGAEFRDETSVLDFCRESDRVIVRVGGAGGEQEIAARYLIGADGMSSAIRRKLRPAHFGNRPSGATVNYYFESDAGLDPGTLYMFYSSRFSPLMFAWVYKKDDWWVVGTGADRDLLKYAETFLSYVEERYSFKGRLVRKEGFSTPMEPSIFLGDGNVLLAGDAAGLVDMYRGLGMDNAALSARFAVKAVLEAGKTGHPAIGLYGRLMSGMVSKMHRNGKRQAARYAAEEALQRSLSTPRMIRDGMLMLVAMQADRFLPPERIITLPL